MAWSETYILNRARQFAEVYADASQLTAEYVRSAWQDFFFRTGLYEVNWSINTVAGQQSYPHPLFRVLEVWYNDCPLELRVGRANSPYELGYWAYLRPYRVVLGFEPSATGVLRIIGHGIPTSVDGLSYEPEGLLQDAIARKAAADFLLQYRDPQTQSGALAYLQLYNQVVEEVEKQHMQAVLVRGNQKRVYGVRRVPL